MFCPSGNALTPVRRLRELAAKMLTGEPPVEAWVQTIIADAAADKGQRRLTAMTNGLRMLVGREIEIMPVARDREKLLEAVHQLLRFTLQRGAGFDEGDSVKLRDGDAACVRYASEGQRQGIPIFETRLVKPDADRQSAAGCVRRDTTAAEIGCRFGYAATRRIARRSKRHREAPGRKNSWR